jgi:hypothetical protein
VPQGARRPLLHGLLHDVQLVPGLLTQWGPGDPPGRLGLAIPWHSNPLPIEFAWDLMEVTYHRPPWLTGSYHPRLVHRLRSVHQPGRARQGRPVK